MDVPWSEQVQVVFPHYLFQAGALRTGSQHVPGCGFCMLTIIMTAAYVRSAAAVTARSTMSTCRGRPAREQRSQKPMDDRPRFIMT